MKLELDLRFQEEQRLEYKLRTLIKNYVRCNGSTAQAPKQVPVWRISSFEDNDGHASPPIVLFNELLLSR